MLQTGLVLLRGCNGILVASNEGEEVLFFHLFFNFLFKGCFGNSNHFVGV